MIDFSAPIVPLNKPPQKRDAIAKGYVPARPSPKTDRLADIPPITMTFFLPILSDIQPHGNEDKHCMHGHGH
jgi:hypothetical protein